MKLTPLERRKRIFEIAEADADYKEILTEYNKHKGRFDRFTDRLPKKFGLFLQSYPYTGYFLHAHMLTLICEHMKFSDED